MSALPNPTAESAAALRDWLAPFRRVFVLTGAGCSTNSGIPDYRDADGQWKRTPPVTFQAFTGDPRVNARYWARSFIGWPRIDDARPNGVHRALADWESRDGVSMLLTQNVDGLHQRAGSPNVVDLHGRLDSVVCLQCRALSSRAELQGRLAAANPDWTHLEATTAPDGDADLDGHDFTLFNVPACEGCGGMLKPDVVFFGENVPRDSAVRAGDALMTSDAMLVVGSSLMVYSGFRFARMAHEAGIPLAILNRGRTRADELAAVKIEEEAGAVLQEALAHHFAYPGYKKQ